MALAQCSGDEQESIAESSLCLSGILACPQLKGVCEICVLGVMVRLAPECWCCASLINPTLMDCRFDWVPAIHWVFVLPRIDGVMLPAILLLYHKVYIIAPMAIFWLGRVTVDTYMCRMRCKSAVFDSGLTVGASGVFSSLRYTITCLTTTPFSFSLVVSGDFALCGTAGYLALFSCPL